MKQRRVIRVKKISVHEYNKLIDKGYVVIICS